MWLSFRLAKGIWCCLCFAWNELVPLPFWLVSFHDPRSPTVPPSNSHNLIDSLCGRSGHGDGRKLKLHQNCVKKSSMSGSLRNRRILFIPQKCLPMCFKNKQWKKSGYKIFSTLPFCVLTFSPTSVRSSIRLSLLPHLISNCSCKSLSFLGQSVHSPSPHTTHWSSGYNFHFLRLPAPWEKAHPTHDNPDGYQITLYSNSVHLECVARFLWWIQSLHKYFSYQI